MKLFKKKKKEKKNGYNTLLNMQQLKKYKKIHRYSSQRWKNKIEFQRDTGSDLTIINAEIESFSFLLIYCYLSVKPWTLCIWLQLLWFNPGSFLEYMDLWLPKKNRVQVGPRRTKILKCHLIFYWPLTVRFYYTHQKLKACPRGVMVKAMDCRIVVSEFVLQSRYFVHFRANTLGKERYEPLYPPSYGLNSTTTVLLREWLWH